MYYLEMHLHTLHNSGCAKVSPRRIVKYYKKSGYNGIVCSNHLNECSMEYLRKRGCGKAKEKFFADFYKLRNLCKAQGIDVFFGIELALRGKNYGAGKENCNDILIYGCTPEEISDLFYELIDLTPQSLFALAEQKGWLVVQAHPYRAHTERLPHDCLHGVEVFNGHPHHDSHNDMALAFAKEHNLIQTAGSDYHFPRGEGSGIATPRPPKDEKDIVQILLSGNYTLLKNTLRSPK